MAVGSFAVLATSPYRLRYRLTADGGGAATKTQSRTQMIADCANGPLKAYLTKLTTMVGFTSTNMRVSITCRSLPGTAVPAQVADNDANNIDFVVAAALGVADFEIALIHSMVF